MSPLTFADLATLINEMDEATRSQPAVVFLSTIGTHAYVQAAGPAHDIDQQGDLSGELPDDQWLLSAR